MILHVLAIAMVVAFVLAVVLIVIRTWDAAEPGTLDLSLDWCAVCFRDLPRGEVWEVREHLANTHEMGLDGGSFMATTYCAEHAPEGAIQV